MPSVLDTATAVGDHGLDVLKSGEGATLRIVRAFSEGVQPVSDVLPNVSYGPGAKEVIDWAFTLIEKVVDNLHGFMTEVVDALPAKTEAKPAAPRTARAESKAA